MSKWREQAIKDVEAVVADADGKITSQMRVYRYTITQREAVLELRERLEVLLEEHSCDDGSVDYDGSKTECERCTPAREVYERTK